MIDKNKVMLFAELLEKEQLNRLYETQMDCPSNIKNVMVTVKRGIKYTKVDVGNSGKYMIDDAGNIFGIRGYGQVNKKHYYGTLDTINDYYWGSFHAYKK